jgi:hypothetical protein
VEEEFAFLALEERDMMFDLLSKLKRFGGH